MTDRPLGYPKEGNIWAFTKNNIVINTVVFSDDEHENTILLFKDLWGADNAINCLNVGYVPGPGFIWDGINFTSPTLEKNVGL